MDTHTATATLTTKTSTPPTSRVIAVVRKLSGDDHDPHQGSPAAVIPYPFSEGEESSDDLVASHFGGVIDSAKKLSSSPADAETPLGGMDDDSDGEVDRKYTVEHETLQQEQILKAGYLKKRATKRRIWHKRWFVLRTTRLAYYKNEKEYELLGVIELSDINAIAEVELKRKENVFGIVTRDRNLFVRTSTVEEMEDWMVSLKASHRDVARGAHLSSPKMKRESSIGRPAPPTRKVSSGPGAAPGMIFVGSAPNPSMLRASTSEPASAQRVTFAGNLTTDAAEPPHADSNEGGNSSDAHSQSSLQGSIATGNSSVLTVASNTPSMIGLLPGLDPFPPIETRSASLAARSTPTAGSPSPRTITFTPTGFITPSIRAELPTPTQLITDVPLSPSYASPPASPNALRELLSDDDDEDADDGVDGDLDEETDVIHDDHVVMQGYLQKRSGTRYNKSWKKRWFVLRNGTLTCYKDDKWWTSSYSHQWEDPTPIVLNSFVPSGPLLLCCTLDDVGFFDAPIYDLDRYPPGTIPSNDTITALQCSRFLAKQTSSISLLNTLVEEGTAFLAKLYAHRSCARAIPPVQRDGTAEGRENLAKATYAVLLPEIRRMQQWMHFLNRVLKETEEILSSTLASLAETPSPTSKDANAVSLFPGTPFLLALSRVIDLLYIFDAMKRLKGSVNNDFSLYKRTLPMMEREISIEVEAQENHKLYLFLGQSNQCANELAKIVDALPGCDEIIQDMANILADYLENGTYMYAEEKHSMLRAMAFALFILDGNSESKDVTKRKKLKIDRFGKLFKACPVVPLYGDMPVSLSAIYGKAPHLSASKWGGDISNAAATSPGGEAARSAEYQSLQKQYLLTSHIETSRAEYIDFLTTSQKTINSVGNTLMDGQARASSGVQQQAFSPADDAKIYSSILTGLKLLGALNTKVLEQTAWKFENPATLAQNPNILPDSLPYELAVKYNYSREEKQCLIENFQHQHYKAVLRHMYREAQEFAKTQLTEFHVHSLKRKKAIAGVIKLAKDIYTDTRNSKEGSEPLSVTQLHILRSLLELGFSDRAKGMKGGLMKEKSFKDNHISDYQTFVSKSYFFVYMYDIPTAVARASDLSNLWFKEFYLELSKQVQFPIRMSLPWILVEYILESNSPDMINNVFHPFEIYNDAGRQTLYTLRSKYIYDEITAEVATPTKCFEYKLTSVLQIYHHYKRQASIIVLSADYKADLAEAVSSTLSTSKSESISPSTSTPVASMSTAESEEEVQADCFELLLQQTNLEELDTLLQISQPHYKLSGAPGPSNVIPESFEDILADVDERVGGGAQNAPFSSFIGQPHFHDILNWTGKERGAAIILSEIANHIKHTLLAYIRVIRKGTPQTLKLPLFEYGTAGCFEYFSAHFKPLLSYDPLKSEVFQAFREIGNAVLLVREFDIALKLHNFYSERLTGSTTDKAEENLENNTNVSQRTGSLLRPFVLHIERTLQSVMHEDADDGAAISTTTELNEFYKIWSALIFTYCIPPKVQGDHCNR
ncbi:cytoplasmic fragile-X interacting family-domain-containing protein [Cladochytrium replicatum]|nr:cytoplasmic fragile-X interacting family-domain-containing protein [Cladochytrium replicatum]